jgi:hypothetical protein
MTKPRLGSSDMWQDYLEEASADEACETAREQIREIIESLCDGKSTGDREAIADELENVVRSAARSYRSPNSQERNDRGVRLVALLIIVFLALAAIWGLPMFLNYIQY